MAKIHTVFRIVKSHLGGGYAHPVKAFDDGKVAEDACRQSAEMFAAVSEGKIIVVTPQGPRAVMTVKQLLIELGVATISHSILPQEVHGAILLSPTGVSLQ